MSTRPGTRPRTRPDARPGASPRDRFARPTRAAAQAIALLATLASGSAIADNTIFKKVEADGSVTFTDRPLPDAEITEGSPISVVGPDPSVVGTSAPAAAPAPVGAPAVVAPVADAAVPSAALPDQPEAPGQPATDAAPAAPAADGLDQISNAGVDPQPADARPGLPVVSRLSIAAPPDGSTVIDAGQAIGVMVVADPPLEGVAQRVQIEVAIDGTVVAAGPLGTLDVPMPERGEHVLTASAFDMTGTKLAESEPSVLHVQKPARP